ncbi:MAG: SDR family oxidoreductase, partial [Chloroflexi bacterium]
GGASGIGRAAAKALARQGARLVIADFDTARMERTVEEILHLGTSEAALALTTDVRNDSSVHSMIEDAIKAMGQVDVLVNMAGVLLQGKLEK